ncbi:hypothetical protein HGB07_06410 [Candidatus Roizmanbacteria bacterium]|nr:hypothetical protein [Candidatus Roizmanbacteria bacterium]
MAITLDAAITSIPSSLVIEKRFSFVNDKILRENIVITMRHIMLLNTIAENVALTGTFVYTVWKDMMLHTSMIVEGCIHYFLLELISRGTINADDVMPKDWQDVNSIDLYNISPDEKVCGVIKRQKTEKLSRNTQFIILNRACLKGKAFDRKIFEIAERIRTKRNHIHLEGLSFVDTLYEKKDVDEIFKDTKTILTHIAKTLK